MGLLINEVGKGTIGMLIKGMPTRLMITGCFILLILPIFYTYNISVWIIEPIVLCILLMYMSIVDIKEHRISNKSLIVMAIICLADMLIFYDLVPMSERVVFFLVLSFIMVPLKLKLPINIMGSGDFKLICISALLLGIGSVTAYLIGSIMAGIGAAILLIFHNADKKSRIPIGPYIALGIWYVYLDLHSCLLLHNFL